MRLIDADALSAEVDKSKHHNPHAQGLVQINHRNEHDHFLRMIDNAPAVDAVNVVWCEECAHFDGLQEESGVCWKTGLIKRQSGYCDEGERRGVEDVATYDEEDKGQ